MPKKCSYETCNKRSLFNFLKKKFVTKFLNDSNNSQYLSYL